MTDNLLREIDEAMRADRAANLWKQHKRQILGAIALLLLVVAGRSAYEHYRQVRGGEHMEQMVTAQQKLDAGKFDEAAKTFGAVAADSSGDLRSLALVWQSRAYVAAKKNEDAVLALQEAAQGNSLWADVACLRLAGLDAKRAAPCLARSDDSPLAIERRQWAAAGAWAEGDSARAAQLLDALIADEMTSQEARTQLMQWRAVVKPESGVTKE